MPSYRGNGNPTAECYAAHESAHAAIRHYYGYDADEIGLTRNKAGIVNGGYCLSYKDCDDFRINSEIYATGLAWQWRGHEDIRSLYSEEMALMTQQGFIFHSDGSTTLPDKRIVLLNMLIVEKDGTIGDIDKSVYLNDCDHLRRNLIKQYGEPTNEKQEEFYWRRLETTFREAWDILDMFYPQSLSQVAHKLLQSGKLEGEKLRETFNEGQN